MENSPCLLTPQNHIALFDRGNEKLADMECFKFLWNAEFFNVVKCAEALCTGKNHRLRTGGGNLCYIVSHEFNRSIFCADIEQRPAAATLVSKEGKRYPKLARKKRMSISSNLGSIETGSAPYKIDDIGMMTPLRCHVPKPSQSILVIPVEAVAAFPDILNNPFMLRKQFTAVPDEILPHFHLKLKRVSPLGRLAPFLAGSACCAGIQDMPEPLGEPLLAFNQSSSQFASPACKVGLKLKPVTGGALSAKSAVFSIRRKYVFAIATFGTTPRHLIVIA
jgi:hypothetical protein